MVNKIFFLKKIFFSFLYLFFVFFFLFSLNTLAYEQTEEICYSQCLAYKFIWRGDYCYDYFINQCSYSPGEGAIKTVMILKNIVQSVISGKPKGLMSISDLFKAFLVCKPVIDNCLTPPMRDCQQQCSTDPYSYGPDFAVGNYRDYPSIRYDEKSKKLTFRVINVGPAYAWDIDVSALYGWSTAMKGVDDEVENFQPLFEEKIDQLIFQGARNGPPKSIGDYIKDFLIDESRFSKWLQEYKSDAKNYNLPTEWTKTISFTPKDDALNRIVLKVNYNNTIPERNWNKNELVFDIDLRPNPPQTFIEEIKIEPYQTYLRKFQISLLLKNYGDLTDKVTLQFREGEEEGKGGLFYEREIVEPVKNTINEQGQWFSYLVDVNPEDIDSCGVNKKYQVEMTDSLGRKQIKKFLLPVYFPIIHGRITDLTGKPIKGATIKAQTGDEVVSDDDGFYHLKVKKLTYFVEKIKLSASHPEYSQSQTKELEIKQTGELNPCEDLTFYADFTLKDVEVKFIIEVYDKDTGELLDNVLLVATNSEGLSVGSRVEKIINGQTSLSEIQPGKFFFTLSKEGYKTLGQTVNAVPENQTLKFYLEKLAGRPDDEGLEIVKPKLLWEKELEKGENFVTMRTTKDGKTTVLYTSKNKPATGKLYFLEALSGKTKKIVSTIANTGNSQASLDVSYNGSTTALCSNDGKLLGETRGKNWIKLFDNQGNAIGEKEYNSELDTQLCEVSFDGFYLYPYFLLNKGFYQYTRFDTEALLDYDRPSKEKVDFGSYQGTHFLRNNNVVGSGKENCVLGIKSIFGNKFIACLNTDISPVFTDSSNDSSSIAVIGTNKIAWFKGGGRIFQKSVETRSNFLSVGVTPGGDYLIFNTYLESLPYRIFKVFSKNNKDEITPLSKSDQEKINKDGNDVVYVAANDKGIFYASLKHKKLSFYQVGKYQKEYKPETQTQQEEINTSTNHNLFMVEGEKYLPLGNIDFRTLYFGKLYFAKNDLNLNLGSSLKVLKITANTYFSIKENNVLVLLKGQINLETKTAFKIYAIKFDRFDLNLFQEKLNQFLNNSLSEENYFLIENIQTKFWVKNEIGIIHVAVESGEVQIKGKDINEKITDSNQIIIDKKNKVEKSKYFGGKVYQIIIILILIIISVLLFVYRNTQIGKLILKILKKILDLAYTIIKKIIYLFLQLMKTVFNRLINKKETTKIRKK